MDFEDSSFSIGRTPVVKLNRVTGGAPVTILAKIESRNPPASVKGRIGAAMIWDAEKRGILNPGKELIEPTSGNTGNALGARSPTTSYPAFDLVVNVDHNRIPLVLALLISTKP